MVIAGFALFVIGFILIVCYPINKKKNSRCTAQTQGVLREIRERYNSKGSLKSMHVYSYYVDGIEYRLETLDHSPQANRIGDSCVIWYNPARPEDAQAFRGSGKYLRAILIVGVMLVLLGTLLGCYGFVQQFILSSVR